MTELQNLLEAAFRDDHANLGLSFYKLSASLRIGDLDEARRLARRIDEEAWPHIAFEEKVFYPALRQFLAEEAIDGFYDDHSAGLTVVREILALPGTESLGEERIRELLRESELMEEHIAHCGSIFKAIARLPLEAQKQMYDQLLALRAAGARWTESVPD